MSQTTGKLNPLPRICPCTGNSLDGCFPDKSFPWEETESAFCKWLWKITPRTQILSKLCENMRHFTIKIFWLQKLANLSASLWKEAGEWSGFPSATDCYGREQTLHFPLSLRPHKLLAPRPHSHHCLLPAAGRLAAHCPAHRLLLEYSPFMTKFHLFKAFYALIYAYFFNRAPLALLKNRCYWGHSLYTWMSPPGFSGSDGTCGELVVMCWHLT